MSDAAPGIAGRAAHLLGDVRSLGRAAPRRALHEVGLRTGLVGRRFRRAEAAALAAEAEGTAPALDAPLGAPGAVPDEAGARAVARAQLLAGGHATVFGRTVEVDGSLRPGGSWHRCPATGVTWPPDVPWWKVDVRGEHRPGDVKWVWEAPRHRDLVHLARAASRGGEGADTTSRLLAATIDGWCTEVAPERGVHWLSNLEIALRSMAWLQVLALAGEHLPAATQARARRQLVAWARHLRLDLRRTQTSMANNHLVGDLVGLAVLDLAMGGDVTPHDHLLVDQVDREVRDDGSMIEESVSYHRFVVELLALRVAAGGAPAAVRGALGRGAGWLARIGALEGEVPQMGDWDEGRAVTSTQDVHDLAGSTRLGLALAGSGAPRGWAVQHDEVAWHVAAGDPLDPPPAEGAGHDVGGGVARVVVGPWHVWLRASAGGWHGHADHSGLVIRRGGQTVVGDPGTAAYNGPLEQRQHHRSSIAHDVVRVGGQDQLEPHRQFRWRHTAHGEVGRPLAHRGATIAWCTHDAYVGRGGPRIVRAVRVAPDGVLCIDWPVPAMPADWQLSLPLHPAVTRQDRSLVLADGHRLQLVLPGPLRSVRGQSEPYDGWWSTTYGAVEPAERLELAGRLTGPVVWQVAEVGAPKAEVRDDGTVVVDDVQLRLWTSATGARLEAGPVDSPPAATAELSWARAAG